MNFIDFNTITSFLIQFIIVICGIYFLYYKKKCTNEMILNNSFSLAVVVEAMHKHESRNGWSRDIINWVTYLCQDIENKKKYRTDVVQMSIRLWRIVKVYHDNKNPWMYYVDLINSSDDNCDDIFLAQYLDNKRQENITEYTKSIHPWEMISILIFFGLLLFSTLGIASIPEHLLNDYIITNILPYIQAFFAYGVVSNIYLYYKNIKIDSIKKNWVSYVWVITKIKKMWFLKLVPYWYLAPYSSIKNIDKCSSYSVAKELESSPFGFAYKLHIEVNGHEKISKTLRLPLTPKCKIWSKIQVYSIDWGLEKFELDMESINILNT